MVSSIPPADLMVAASPVLVTVCTRDRAGSRAVQPTGLLLAAANRNSMGLSWAKAGKASTAAKAAADFMRQGLRVVVIDKNIIGGSSTGRSAGFLTPDSELELHQLVRRYGVEAARDIWEMPCRGIDRLVENIKKFDIECGLLKQDS